MNQVTIHQITIQGHKYLVYGSRKETLESIAIVIGLDYDAIEPTKIGNRQTLIKIWTIGELKDYIDEKSSNKN